MRLKFTIYPKPVSNSNKVQRVMLGLGGGEREMAGMSFLSFRNLRSSRRKRKKTSIC